MSDLVFFYGTLMMPFNRLQRLRVEMHLELLGRGSISAALFDLGLYPAAVPASDTRVWGEVYFLHHPAIVLQALDEVEGYRASEPETSLYIRRLTAVTYGDGTLVDAWVYFYNAPLGRAQRIESGDYLEHLRPRASFSD